MRRVRRACSDKEMRALLISALKAGCDYKITKRGIILYGENGQSVSAHFTTSDLRGHKNFLAYMRRAKLKGFQ